LGCQGFVQAFLSWMTIFIRRHDYVNVPRSSHPQSEIRLKLSRWQLRPHHFFTSNFGINIKGLWARFLRPMD
jgi:hypothetical protein